MALQRNLAQRINVGDALTRSAAARPGHLAVVDTGASAATGEIEDRRLSYTAFDGSVNRLAHGLLGRGHAAGDALPLAAGNSAEFLAVYYACARTGVVSVPINPGWGPDEVASVPRHSRARGIVVESSKINDDSRTLSVRNGTFLTLEEGLEVERAVYDLHTDHYSDGSSSPPGVLPPSPRLSGGR